ncbi:MAG: PKD domain-containing protein [Planctomycetes bacterium]|nr:PKD domain-containing protein [Planctomycetota bacterium]
MVLLAAAAACWLTQSVEPSRTAERPHSERTAPASAPVEAAEAPAVHTVADAPTTEQRPAAAKQAPGIGLHASERLKADLRWRETLSRPSQRELQRRERAEAKHAAFGAPAPRKALESRLYSLRKARDLALCADPESAEQIVLQNADEEAELTAQLAALPAEPAKAATRDTTAGPDAFEPNEDPTNPTNATDDAFTVPGYYPNLSIDDEDDEDWFVINVPSATTLRVDLYFTPGDGGSDLDLYVYNATANAPNGWIQGGEVAKSESGNDNESIVVPVTAGDYLIHVTGWSGSTNDYDMSILLMDDVLLALELSEGETSINADDEPMDSLLDSLVAPGAAAISHDKNGFDFPLGATSVTWSFWSDTVNGTLLTTFTDYVFVLEYGQTPLYLARSHFDSDVTGAYATAGNHGSNVVATADGVLHAVWHDPEAEKIWYQRSSARDPATGAVTWDASSFTEISDSSHVDTESFVAIAASSGAVHIVWEHGGNLYYRRWLKGAGWAPGGLSTIVDTGANGGRRDNSPDIAAYSDTEVHVISPQNLGYTYSLDGGATWSTVENLAGLTLPTHSSIKYPSVAVDSTGDVHVVFTLVVHGGWPPGGSGHWKIYYLHRKRPLAINEAGVGNGKWIENHATCDTLNEWKDLGTGVSEQSLGDWVEIQVDSKDNIHLGWHGTGLSRSAGFDDAWYQFRPASAMGSDDPTDWQAPLNLHPGSQGSLNEYSFTPSLATDGASNLAIPVFMYKALGLTPYDPTASEVNYYDMASAMRIMRGGSFDASHDTGALVDLSNYAISSTEGMATWWPCAAPAIYKDQTSGKGWLDILQAMRPSPTDYRGLVVFQRVDVTGLLFPDKASGPDPADTATGVPVNKNPSWDAAFRADSYDVYFGTDQTAVANASTSTAGIFVGNQAGTSFEPGALTNSQTYYWRIDTKNANGTVTGDVWSFTVTATPNQAPSLAAIGDKSVTVLSNLSFTITATDPEDDILTYSATGLPSGATLDPDTGEFSWTPAAGQLGDFIVTFIVSDSLLTDQETITITVNPLPGNNAPKIDSALIADPPVVFPGDTVDFLVGASDPDDDDLFYDWEWDDGTANGSSPAPSHIYAAPGVYTVVLTISDGLGGEVVTSVTVTVLESLAVDKMLLSVNFGKPLSDKGKANGTIDLPLNFVPGGQDVQIDVDGVAVAMTLDPKGKGVNEKSKFSLKFKKNLNAWTWKLSLQKGDYRATWLAIGMDNADHPTPGVDVTARVIIDIDGTGFGGERLLNYRSKVDKTGKAKQVKF